MAVGVILARAKEGTHGGYSFKIMPPVSFFLLALRAEKEEKRRDDG